MCLIEKLWHLVLSWIVTQVNKLDPGLGQVHLHKTFKLKLILNGKCGAINSGLILVLQRLFESDLKSDPSPSHSNLVSIYIYSGLLLMVSCICPRAAGLTSIMAQWMTRIVVPFWASGVYLSLTGIMAPLRATPVLCQIKYRPRTPRPDFNSDLSKQIRHCIGSVALHERNIPVM